MELTFRVAKIEESEQILDFLRVHFYPEEPVTVGIEPKEPVAEDEQYTIANINYGTTIIAEHKTTIVGVIIAGPITTDSVTSLIVESKKTLNYKWKQIAKLLAKIQANANIFTRYNVTKSLHIHALAVDPQYRGKSLGTQLIEQISTLGASLNYPLISIDCTSYYSINLAMKTKMELVTTMKYSDYKDENGLEIFSVKHPHSEIKTFVKKLNYKIII